MAANNGLFYSKNNINSNQPNIFQININNQNQEIKQSLTHQPIPTNNIDVSINNNRHSEKNVITSEPNNNLDNISIISNSTNQEINFQNEINQQINYIKNNISNQNQIINLIQQQLNNLSDEHKLITEQISVMSIQQKNIGDQINFLRTLLQQIYSNDTNNLLHNNSINKIAIFKYKDIPYNIEFNENDIVFNIIQKFRKQKNDYSNKKFIYNGVNLNPNLTCKSAGLVDNPVIIVNDS